MRTYFDCMPCFLRQAINASRTANATEEQTDLILRDVLQHLEESDWELQPPRLAVELYRMVRRTTCDDDPYLTDKRRINALALQLLPELQDRMLATTDPFVPAVRLAMAGNVIDLVAFDTIDREMLLQEFDRATSVPPAVDHIEALRAALQRSTGPVLYVTDNAGEIAFDRLLIEQIIAMGVPAERISAMVRGGPAINDALYEDAATVGLSGLVEVTDSGIDAPGFLLDLASPEALERYEEAEVVVAKGQGNIESMPLDDPRVFFLLRVKCPVLSRVIDLERGSQVAVQGGSDYIGGVV